MSEVAETTAVEEEVGQPEFDEVYEAFSAAVDAGKEEDDVKMEMIKAGATFKNVTRLYNQYLIDAGLAISKEEKDALVDNLLSGEDLSDEDNFNALVEAICEQATGVTEKSAASLIRAYGKKEGLEVYKKPKAEGGAVRNPFVTNFHAALIENPHMDEQGLRDVIAALEPQHQVNPLRWFNQHNNIRKMVNAIAEKYSV